MATAQRYDTNMYDIGDDDLAKSYDPKKVAANLRTPQMPKTEVNYDADLISVTKDKSPKAGKFFAFKFRVTKSNNELVPEGAVYSERFYPGASDVDYAMFWDRVTPLLMAAFGETNAQAFSAPDKLGELLSLTAGCGGAELGLKFACGRVLEEARKDKTTGQYNPKHLNPDGTPKKFPRDHYRSAAATASAPAPAPAQAA